MPWEIRCSVCGRSSWDGCEDDRAGERCFACGQWPALDPFVAGLMRAFEVPVVAPDSPSRLVP